MSEIVDFPGLVRHYRSLDEDEEDSGVASTNDVLKNTFMIYGSIFAALFLIFLWARKRYPRTYNVRNTVPEYKCSLAEDTLGTLRWIYRVFLVPEEDMYGQCGLDSVVYLRMLRYGCRVAFVGVLNSIYLMPIYGTSPSDGNDSTGLDRVNIGSVPQKDARVYATVIAAYIVFGYAMWLLLKEFQWFTKYRHDFLARPRPDNYTVYVSGIPVEYRNNESLLAYFHDVYPGSVVEAKMALNLKNLESHVAARKKIVSKLEHSINVLNVTGKRPTHTPIKSRCGRKVEEVDSINAYTEQLRDYNQKISTSITSIEERINAQPASDEEQRRNTSMASSSFRDPENQSVESVSLATDAESKVVESAALINEDEDKKQAAYDSTNRKENEKGPLQSNVSNISSEITSGLSTGITAVTHAAKSLLGSEEGTPLDAAFVTFASLRARASALQMTHHATPFTMNVWEAPLPKDVFWGNVGLTHKTQQLSWLLGKVLTGALCIFWAIPVSFVSSLANIETLKEEVPFLRDWIKSAPWLEDVLAQLAPLLLFILVALLPVFLMYFSKLEGHVSTGTLTAAFFIKLCIFNIIHTFLIVTVSSSIFQSIETIVNNPSSIVEMLAIAIPDQASFFIQYSLVRTFVSMGFELTRLIPIIKAYIRTKVGPNLTEKERNTPWLGLAPLSEPGEFDHAATLSDLLLFFLILFAYSVISPFMSFVMAFVFGVTGMSYRHQFIYIYPTTNDSGGLLWTQAVRVIIACMFIAQLTLVGVLGLKKSPGAVGMSIPLLVITVLFAVYLEQQHYIVARYLPSIGAIEKDNENIASNFDKDIFKGLYKQPALQEKHAEPENMPQNTERSWNDNPGA